MEKIEENKEIKEIKRKKEMKKTICCLTWNMHGQTPTERELNDLLQKHKEKNFDIYVIGSQECLRSIFKSLFYSDKSIWENQLKLYFGDEYEMLSSVTLAAIHIIIFVKKNIRNNINAINYNSVKTGAYNYLGNKGAVGIWFTLININIMFINSHLAAGYYYLKKRNNNFEYIMNNIHPNYLNVDFIVFMGDLNYRLNIPFVNVNDIRNNHLNYITYDQLNLEKKEIKKILNFEEGDIKFLPTFKYINNTDIFDADKIDKLPAWTDRILFIKRTTIFSVLDVELIEYNSMQDILMSDHKPVYSYFNLTFQV